MSLKGEIILIAGAARRIGRSLELAAAQAGAVRFSRSLGVEIEREQKVVE